MSQRTPAPKPAAKWKAAMPYPTWPFAKVSGAELQKHHAAQQRQQAAASVGSALL